MPLYRRRYRPRRTFRRKYGKKYGRKRFSKKKFVKSVGRPIQTITSLAMARQANVKIRWVQQFTGSTTANTTRWLFSGNAIYAYPSNVQPFPFMGSSYYGTATATAGDWLPSAILPWGQFFGSYKSYGSGIKIDYSSRQNTATDITYIILGAFNNDVLPSTLDGLNYLQLAAMPQCKHFQVGPGTGGPNRIIKKAFRKTKHMIGIKDIRDCEDLEANLPTSTTLSGTPQEYFPTDGFYWYFRVFGAPADVEYAVTIQVDQYLNLNDRRDLPSFQAIAAP